MSIKKDDPRVTAYALGELTEEERIEFERELEKDPSLQNAVRDVREIAGDIGNVFAAEPEMGLTSEGKRASSTLPGEKKSGFGFQWKFLFPILVAAGLMFFVVYPEFQKEEMAQAPMIAEEVVEVQRSREQVFKSEMKKMKVAKKLTLNKRSAMKSAGVRSEMADSVSPPAAVMAPSASLIARESPPLKVSIVSFTNSKLLDIDGVSAMDSPWFKKSLDRCSGVYSGKKELMRGDFPKPENFEIDLNVTDGGTVTMAKWPEFSSNLKREFYRCLAGQFQSLDLSVYGGGSVKAVVRVE